MVLHQLFIRLSWELFLLYIYIRLRHTAHNPIICKCYSIKQDMQNIEYLKVGPKWNIMCLLHGLKHLKEWKTHYIDLLNKNKKSKKMWKKKSKTPAPLQATKDMCFIKERGSHISFFDKQTQLTHLYIIDATIQGRYMHSYQHFLVWR